MNFTINEEEKAALLEDAREAIGARLNNRPPQYRRPAQFAPYSVVFSVLKDCHCKPTGLYLSINVVLNVLTIRKELHNLIDNLPGRFCFA